MYTYWKIVSESHAFAKFIGKSLLEKKNAHTAVDMSPQQ